MKTRGWGKAINKENNLRNWHEVFIKSNATNYCISKQDKWIYLSKVKN